MTGKLNDLRSSRIMFGQRPTGARMFHPEHVQRDSPSDPLRPFKDRISIGDNDFKRLFDKINLTHATFSIDSRSGKSNRESQTLMDCERDLTWVKFA